MRWQNPSCGPAPVLRPEILGRQLFQQRAQPQRRRAELGVEGAAQPLADLAANRPAMHAVDLDIVKPGGIRHDPFQSLKCCGRGVPERGRVKFFAPPELKLLAVCGACRKTQRPKTQRLMGENVPHSPRWSPRSGGSRSWSAFAAGSATTKTSPQSLPTRAVGPRETRAAWQQKRPLPLAIRACARFEQRVLLRPLAIRDRRRGERRAAASGEENAQAGVSFLYAAAAVRATETIRIGLPPGGLRGWWSRLDSASRISSIPTSRRVPGTSRSDGQEFTAAASDAQDARMARFSARDRVGSASTSCGESNTEPGCRIAFRS